MTVRLATAKDIAAIIRLAASIGQFYGESMALQLATDPDYITVVDLPTGLFYARLDKSNPGVVLACITVAASKRQVDGLYRAAVAEAVKRWPVQKMLKTYLWPNCATLARAGVTTAGMSMSSRDAEGRESYELPWDSLLKALG